MIDVVNWSNLCDLRETRGSTPLPVPGATSCRRVTLALSSAHSELQCALLENASDGSVCLPGLLWGFPETKARRPCPAAGLQGALHTHRIDCPRSWNLLLIFKIFLALPAYFPLYVNFRFVLPTPSPPLAHPSPPNKSYQNFGWKSGEPIHEFGKIWCLQTSYPRTWRVFSFSLFQTSCFYFSLKCVVFFLQILNISEEGFSKVFFMFFAPPLLFVWE